jgi:dTDP-glucose 4,6-dehydratase
MVNVTVIVVRPTFFSLCLILTYVKIHICYTIHILYYVDNCSIKLMRTMKTILVTGGYGFVASNFIVRLQTDIDTRGKYKVINIDNMSKGSDDRNLPRRIENYVFVHGDFCNHDLIKRLFETYEISAIYHFGAQTHVDRSFDNPSEFIYSNYLGTANLLDCTIKYGMTKLDKNHKSVFEKFIYVSTDEVTGDATGLREELILHYGLYNPTNPYSATKAGAELLVNSYFYSFRVPVIITRSNNIYGRNQYPEKLIPKCIKLLIDGEKCKIYGDGSSIRNYLHVDDACDAYKLILDAGEVSNMYEMQSNVEVSAIEMVKRLIDLVVNQGEEFEDMNEYNKYVEFVDDRPYHDAKYIVNSTTLENLGWEPTVDFNDGIVKTVQNFVKLFEAEKRLEAKQMIQK